MKRRFIIGSGLGLSAVSAHFHSLAAELCSRGHWVEVIGPSETSAPRQDFPFPTQSWPSQRPVRLADALFLFRKTMAVRPDCYIANFAPVNIMSLVGWLSQVPCRVVWHHTLTSQILADSGLSPSEARYQVLRKRFVFRFATHFGVNSRATLHDLSQTFGVAEKKCKVWLNSLRDPQSNVRPKPIHSRERLIICAGRFHPSKGQDVLVTALAILRDKLEPFKVEFLGDGPTLCIVRQRAHELGLSQICNFRGFIPHDDLLARMASARISVVPSRSEAFGLVNIESLALGTPVVASEVDGIPEIIRDGMDGFLFPANNATALASKLQALLENPTLLAEFSQNARQRYLETFEQSKVVAAQADWFEAICGEAKRKAKSRERRTQEAL